MGAHQSPVSMRSSDSFQFPHSFIFRCSMEALSWSLVILCQCVKARYVARNSSFHSCNLWRARAVLRLGEDGEEGVLQVLGVGLASFSLELQVADELRRLIFSIFSIFSISAILLLLFFLY